MDGKESMITLDYTVDPSKASDDFTEEGEEPAVKKRKSTEGDVRYLHTQLISSHFTLKWKYSGDKVVGIYYLFITPLTLLARQYRSYMPN